MLNLHQADIAARDQMWHIRAQIEIDERVQQMTDFAMHPYLGETDQDRVINTLRKVEGSRAS